MANIIVKGEMIYIILKLSVDFMFKILCEKKTSSDYTKIKYNWIKATKTLKGENVIYCIKITSITFSDDVIVTKLYVPNNMISNCIKQNLQAIKWDSK